MNEFFNQKITFLLGYIVIILTVAHSELLINLKDFNLILFGYVIPIYHVIYFHVSLLGLSVLFYSLYFIKENKFNLTRTLGEIFYALSFIIVITFLIIYLINYTIYYLSNFITKEFVILLIFIIIFISSVFLSISSTKYIRNLGMKIKTNSTDSEPMNKLVAHRSYLFIKYLTDKIMSIIWLWGLLPILFISTIIIFSQTQGKVIFKQTRIGKNAKRFKLLKFLTIKESKDGKKIIKLGEFFRRLYIDELPTIFNLLKGDLSLVGPRPMREFQFESIDDEAFKELYTSVKPGLISLTSLIFNWQDMNLTDIYKIESYYIKNRGLKLDLSILLNSFSILTFSRFPTK